MKSASLWLFALLAAVLGSLASESEATTHRTLRLQSDPVILDGCVLFAQGIGSLTKLDLATGEVLLRKAPEKLRYGGELRPHRLGIVMVDFGDVALLHPETFDVIWSVTDANVAAIAEDRFLVSDGNQTVTCHRLTDGEPVWSVEMPGGWQLSAEGNVGVVSTPEIYDQQHALKAMRLDSGQRLYTVRAERRERFLRVYQVGQAVYVLTYVGDIPAIDKPPPTALVELGQDGRRVRSIDYASPEIISERGDKSSGGGFYFEGRYFSVRDGCREAYDYEPDQVVYAWKTEDVYPEPLKAGLLLDRGVSTPAGGRHTILDLASDQRGWAIYPTQLQESGVIGRIAEGEGCLVFSSMDGHVECIDLVTGQPRWMYVFPLIRAGRVFYYDAQSQLSDLASEPVVGPKRPNRVAGSLVLRQDFDSGYLTALQKSGKLEYSATVVFDPAPDVPPVFTGPDFGLVRLSLSSFPLAALIGLYQVLRRIRLRRPAASQVAGELTSSDWRWVSFTSAFFLSWPLAGLLLPSRTGTYVNVLVVGSSVLLLTVACYSEWKASSLGRKQAAE
ncbi:MAG: PQQ-binding-like beta-propeller repeat protein [Planctomycetota bacterium]